MFGTRRRRAAALHERAEYRARRKILDDDVTVFGVQLEELHYDTLADELDADASTDYRRALPEYETAKDALTAAETLPGLDSVQEALVEGRFHRACVLTRVSGDPLPRRLSECFFNPQHGPSSTEVSWAPPGGTPRTVPVCRSDANRLAAGEEPESRMIRIGDRWVPWFGKDQATSLLRSNVDYRRVREARSQAHGQATLYGAAPQQPMDYGSSGW